MPKSVFTEADARAYVRELMALRGVSQYRLAQLTGLALQTINGWLRGRKGLSLPHYLSLLAALEPEQQ